MSNREEQSSRRSSLAVWLSVVVMLPVAYVLFSGPAVWLFQHGYLKTVLPFIYKPLILLEMSNTPPGELLKWYWSLWKQRFAQPFGAAGEPASACDLGRWG